MTGKPAKPAPKRGNGRGNVRRLASGRYQWRASVTLPNGEVQRVSGTVKTKTEAEEALREALTDAARGDFSISRDTTVQEYLQGWFAARAEGQSAKYNEAQSGLIATHIVPGLGKRRLTSVTPTDLQVFYAQLQHQDKRRKDTLGQPLSDSMKRQVHNLLHQAFAEAVRHGHLSRNPTDLVRPRYARQAAQQEAIKSWTPEEAQRFYRVARTDRWGVIFCFTLSTGLRIGEALGLRWESVDLAASQIVVKEALVSLRGRMHRTTPKTARSRRTVPISGDALAILKERASTAGRPGQGGGGREIRRQRFGLHQHPRGFHPRRQPLPHHEAALRPGGDALPRHPRRPAHLRFDAGGERGGR